MEAEIEYRVANVIGWVFPPFIMAVGTFGNVMSIVIVRRCLRPSALRVFFIALAGADLIMLYNGLLMRWLGFTFHVHVHILHDIICKVNMWLNYASMMTSSWALTVLTMERVRAVLVPKRGAKGTSKHLAYAIVATIFIVPLLANVHVLVDFHLVTNWNGTSTTLCTAVDDDYRNFVGGPWTWVVLALYCLIPFAVLTVSNGLILWKVRKSGRAAYSATATANARRKSVSYEASQRKVSWMTKYLFALSFTFLVTTLPFAALNIFHHPLLRKARKSPRNQARLHLAWNTVVMLMFIKSAAHFYLSLLCGHTFQRELRRCLSCFSRRPSVVSPLQKISVTTSYLSNLKRSSRSSTGSQTQPAGSKLLRMCSLGTENTCT